MGCDGGSIEKRDELVKVKKAPQAKDPKEISRIRWSTCTLSNEPLKHPVVACALGNLYNKEEVIAHLISKSMPENFSHIRGLKDLVDLKLTPNPDAENNGASLFICPITRFEAGGSYSFVALRPCGCVLARKALREIQSNDCLVCGKPYQKDNVLAINPGDDELVEIKKKLSEQIELQLEKTKKSKRNKKSPTSTTATTTSMTSTTTTTNSAESSSSSSASSKRKALAEEKVKAEKKAKIPAYLKPELVNSQVYSSIFTSSLKKGDGPVKEETFLCRNVVRT